LLVKNFRDVDLLGDKDFEFFVKDLLEKSGWTDAVITEVGKEYKHGDGGVDIFAYKAGRKFAIEVKQRNLQSNVDVKALNQLVTGARLAKVNHMILVTNSYFTAEVQVRALRLGVELIDRDGLKSLWVQKHSEIGRDIKPRKYQIQIIQEAVNQYNIGKNKILIEMATGLGKTYTVALLIKELTKNIPQRPRIMFVAHQIEILLQSVTAFKNVFGVGSYSFSACFSGSFPEETDFVFASFDTLYGQLDVLKKETFDYIIVDEAHHTPARTYSEVVKNFSPKLLIGLTATPYRSDEKNVTDFFGGRDGHIGKYDLVWGLKHKKLAFPKYLVLLDDLDQSKIDQLDSGLSVSDLDKRLFLHKKDEEVVKIIETTVSNKNIENVKGIVFCRNIRHLKHLLGFFEMGTATCVHSKMNDQERRENIRNFREGDYKYILVCDLFNEGIDIPETNLLIFMRYTGSRTIWLQQLGRGLRKTPNKEYVHVLDFVGSLERLNEVKALSKAVKDKKLEKEHLEDTEEKNDKKQVVHDGSLEVHYSESAAKVLKLIEELKYRLNTREALIEKILRYREQEFQTPEISDIEKVIDDVSSDQLSTYFDSYYGYLTAAFGTDFDVLTMKSRLSNFVEEYLANNGIEPSLRAISLNFSFKSLLEFTESEISELMPKVSKIPPSDRGENKEQSRDLKKPTGKKDSLVRQYKGAVSSRGDVKKLSNLELVEIKKEFSSISLFLKALKGLDDE
jgi:superfamily II DNA or RNA helicase